MDEKREPVDDLFRFFGHAVADPIEHDADENVAVDLRDGYIFIGIMLDWIRDGMTEEPEKIVDRLALLIHDSIREALARFKI